MPIYEYSCEKCGREFEELVFGEAAAHLARLGGSRETHKLMSRCAHCSSNDGDGGYALPASAGGGLRPVAPAAIAQAWH